MLFVFRYAGTVLALKQHTIEVVGYVYATSIAAMSEEHVLNVLRCFRWAGMRRKALLNNTQDGFWVVTGLVTRGLNGVVRVVGQVVVQGWACRVVRAGTRERVTITHETALLSIT